MTQARRGLIIGISGQDGNYLAKFLLAKGYEVHGTSRNSQEALNGSLKKSGMAGNVAVHSVPVVDYKAVASVIANIRPDEIYNLAGQSSVGSSFNKPVETAESILIGTINLLEAIRNINPEIRFFGAGSSECYGDTGVVAANEKTPFQPKSPYAIAKAAAHWQIANYRECYGLHLSNGILFNHESPLRSERFVTMKIVSAACLIAKGKMDKLELGDIEIHRDWGWAPEYVEAMWAINQHDKGDDFVVATGRTIPLALFIERVFQEVGLDWRKHVVSHPELRRPTEIGMSCADPAKIRMVLGWKHRFEIEDIVHALVDHELKNY